MTDGRKEFQNRVTKVSKFHRRLANGYTASIRKDGLVVVKPHRLQFALPVRGFVLLMAIFMLFKGFMLSELGEAEYYDRLSVLKTGNPVEQIGAMIMGIDPVSGTIAQFLPSPS